MKWALFETHDGCLHLAPCDETSGLCEVASDHDLKSTCRCSPFKVRTGDKPVFVHYQDQTVED